MPPLQHPAGPCLPVSDVPKHQRSNQHPQHEGGLTQLGQPLLFTHQVPVCHYALIHFCVVVNKVPAARLYCFVAIKLI